MLKNGEEADDVPVISSFKNSCLKNRYIVGRLIDQGENGQIHTVYDKHQNRLAQQLVVKSSSDIEGMYTEVLALKTI